MFAATLVSRRVLLSLTLLTAWPAPGSAADKADVISDDWCGFSIAVAEPWLRAPLRDYTTPGAIRCAWSGPNGASLVILVQEPGSAVSPRVIVDGSSAAMKRNLGATVSVEDVRSVAGMKAMWLVLSGKGNGGNLDGKGPVETTQHWVAVPREKDVIVVLLSCPTADYAGLKKGFESIVGSLKLSGTQTREQKDAK